MKRATVPQRPDRKVFTTAYNRFCAFGPRLDVAYQNRRLGEGEDEVKTARQGYGRLKN
jgi:hypothetical protein